MDLHASGTASTGPLGQRRYPDCCPLIVEDDPSYARLLVEAFKRSGVPEENIRVAVDGERAVSYLSSSSRGGPKSRPPFPTVVILDLWLRRRPGLSVLAWMRSEPALVSVPVAILTGTERAQDVTEARKLGAASFYVKPFCFGDLVTIAAAMVIRQPTLCEASSLPDGMVA